MPDLPDWITRTGGQALSGLGAALPYALPAALGAGIGAMSGQGGGAVAGGALAGGLAAKGVEAESDLKQQQLHIEAQKADIEIQKGRLALEDDKEKDEYAAKSITPELAKQTGMDVETLRRMYKDKPEDYFQTVGMANWVHTMSQDPKFKAMSPQVAAALPNMPPEIAAKVLGKMLDKTYSGKSAEYKKPDGSYAFDVYDPANPADKVTIPLEGQPISTTNIELRNETGKPTKPPSATAMATLATKWTTDAANTTGGGYGGTTYGAPDEARKANAIATGVAQLTGAPYNMDPDAAEKMVRAAVEPKYRKDTGSGLSAADRKLLQASLPKDPPPKKYWNQDRIMNGVRVHIDDKGAVTVLGKAS